MFFENVIKVNFERIELFYSQPNKRRLLLGGGNKEISSILHRWRLRSLPLTMQDWKIKAENDHVVPNVMQVSFLVTILYSPGFGGRGLDMIKGQNWTQPAVNPDVAS